MKKKLLMFGSYVLVAMLATVITLAMVGMNPPSKLDRLEALIEDCFIGEADFQTMEDAAAAAMVKTMMPTGSRRKTPMWAWALPFSSRRTIRAS